MQNEMNLPDEFFERSIVSKYYFDVFWEADETLNFKSIIKQVSRYLLKGTQSFAEAMLKVSRLIECNQFQEAWLIIKDCHRYKYLNIALRQEFVNIRSHLPTIISTTSIYMVEQLLEKKKAWADSGTETDEHEQLSDYKRIHREFQKLKTIEELINFNQFYKESIQRLIFEFIDKHICRMDYTLEYLKDFEFYQKHYKSERRKLDKLISKTNRLKKQLKSAF